jgi:hypothetical protein
MDAEVTRPPPGAAVEALRPTTKTPASGPPPLIEHSGQLVVPPRGPNQVSSLEQLRSYSPAQIIDFFDSYLGSNSSKRVNFSYCKQTLADIDQRFDQFTPEQIGWLIRHFSRARVDAASLYSSWIDKLAPRFGELSVFTLSGLAMHYALRREQHHHLRTIYEHASHQLHTPNPETRSMGDRKLARGAYRIIFSAATLDYAEGLEVPAFKSHLQSSLDLLLFKDRCGAARSFCILREDDFLVAVADHLRSYRPARKDMEELPISQLYQAAAAIGQIESLPDYVVTAARETLPSQRAFVESTVSDFDPQVTRLLEDILKDRLTIRTQFGPDGFFGDIALFDPGTKRPVLIIECDGDQFHLTRNADLGNTTGKDVLKERYFSEQLGIPVVHIYFGEWNHFDERGRRQLLTKSLYDCLRIRFS